MPHSIPLIPSHIPLLSSADPASELLLCLFTPVPPYLVPPSMLAPLTPNITLAAMGTAPGLLPSIQRPPRGESMCHSRLMPCPLTDQLPLVWNLSVLWHGPDREVMLSRLIATEVVRPGKLWSIHLIFPTVSRWSGQMLLCKSLWQVCKHWRVVSRR